MPDNMQNLLQILQARMRVIAFLVAFAMLGAIVYLKVSDAGPKLTPLPPTPSPVALEHKQEVAQDITREFSGDEVPIEKSVLRNLITDDMFSSKAIQENIQKERQATDKVAEAERVKAGNPKEALRLVLEALAIYPHHLGAARMQKELEGQSSTVPGAGAGASTATAKVAPRPAGVVVPRVAPAPVAVPATGAPPPAP